MTVFALLSAGGAPGVTTSALALTLGWPSQVILAECDPSGGDVLAGLLGGHLPASTGLLPLALEAGAGAEVPADTLWRQLVELDEERNRLLLAGISDPRQAAALQSSLPWIADALQAVAADVIADCGRLDSVAAVRPVLSAASLAVLVLRPTLRQASRAVSRVEMLVNLVGRDRVVLLLVGEGTTSGREIARTLGVPVAGQLPEDGKTAGVLSDGAAGRHRLESRPLIRAATTVGRGLREAASAAGPLLGYSDQAVFSLYNPTTPTQPAPEWRDAGQPTLGHSGLGLGPASPAMPGQTQPGQTQPGLSRPGVNQPSLSWPGLSQPGQTQPGQTQPGPSQPGPSQPGAREPRIGLRGLMPPESPVGHVSPDELQPRFPSAAPWDDGTGSRAGSHRAGPPSDGIPGGGRPVNGRPVNGTHYGDASHGNAQNGSRP